MSTPVKKTLSLEFSADPDVSPESFLRNIIESRADSLDAVRRSLLADKALAVFPDAVWTIEQPEETRR